MIADDVHILAPEDVKQLTGMDFGFEIVVNLDLEQTHLPIMKCALIYSSWFRKQHGIDFLWTEEEWMSFVKLIGLLRIKNKMDGRRMGSYLPYDQRRQLNSVFYLLAMLPEWYKKHCFQPSQLVPKFNSVIAQLRMPYNNDRTKKDLPDKSFVDSIVSKITKRGNKKLFD